MLPHVYSTLNHLYFKNCCFQPLSIWKAVRIRPVSDISEQTVECRVAYTVLSPPTWAWEYSRKRPAGGEIDALSKETIVLYLNIERPIVPLSGSQRLWHFSGVKCVSVSCFFFFFVLFFLESYDKGYPFIWREMNETEKGVCVLWSFHLSRRVATVCLNCIFEKFVTLQHCFSLILKFW